MPDALIVTLDTAACVERCHAAQEECLDTMFHCLSAGGTLAERGHIRLLADCQQMCQVAADFLRRGSPLYGAIGALCADICRRCADACAELRPADDQLARCARACRAAADALAEIGGNARGYRAHGADSAGQTDET